MTSYDLVPCNRHVSAIAYGDQKITQLPRIALSSFLKSGKMHPYDDFAPLISNHPSLQGGVGENRRREEGKHRLGHSRCHHEVFLGTASKNRGMTPEMRYPVNWFSLMARKSTSETSSANLGFEKKF
jgi:hypothetical protein